MTQKNCKYPEWLSEYTFDNCKLNRKEYGEFLTNYLVGEHDGFVLNLNGAWGTGKTEFLRRLYSLLTTKGHPTIYIDAWESDFSEVPLSVVASELITQLSKINFNIGTDLDKVSEWLGKALKGTMIAGAGLLTKHFVDDSAAGREFIKSFYESSPKDFLSNIKSNHEEQVMAIKNIRKELGLLAEVMKTVHGKELPVVVLIDELDRCRPSYAIEMLEVIKHFFTTENFVFVVATDTKQLKESIKSVYGASFDSNTYLKRFFNREARLSEPDIEHYLGLQNFNLTEYANKVLTYPNVNSNEAHSIKKYIEWAAKAYELSLRDIDQLVDKLKACLRTALSTFEESNNLQIVNVFCLVVAIIEFDGEHTQFYERKENNPVLEGTFVNDISIDLATGNQSTFSDAYQMNMHNSVKHIIQVQDAWHDNVNQVVYGTHRRTGARDANSYDGVVRSAFRITEQIFQQYHEQSNTRIWLWHDYQLVVQLAGSLK